MRHLSWIITVPVALLAISFAISNREWIVLTLWPMPFQLSAPLYLLVLVSLVVGFLLGGLVAWLGQHHYRRDARQRGERVRELSAEVKSYRDRDAKIAEEANRAAEAARLEASARAADDALRLEGPAAAPR